MGKQTQPPVTEQEFNKAMKTLATKHRDVAINSAEQQQAIEEACKPYTDRINKANKAIDEAKVIVERYATENREELFKDGVKSISTPQGTIGFKMKPASVVIKDDTTDKDVVDALMVATWTGAKDFFVTKHTLDKNAIKKLQDEKTLAKLKKLGVTVEQNEEFYYKEAK